MTPLPRFSVGQKVYLTSKIAPQMNGVYPVTHVANFHGRSVLDRNDDPYEGYSYRLFGVPGDWAEHCLSEAH